MNLGLANKNSLVIGGSRGLGKSIAIGLAKEGAKVGVVARNSFDINETLEIMGGLKEGHWGVSIDMMLENSPRKLVEELSKNQKIDLDIVIHSLGGTLQINDPFCEVSSWRKVWRFNLEIAVELNRLIIPRMINKNYGRIIHISSIAATLNHGSLPYNTVKAALNAYVRNVGAILAPHGIVVSAVMPGAILSQGSSWEIALKEDPGKVANFLDSKIAIRRFATPEEIGAFVVFLSSGNASFFCGNVLPIDGGSR